ncbi:1405_t:CDS:2, partial [Scutellospora calospora]
MLTDALYYRQHREYTSLGLDPTKFECMIESINPQLKIADLCNKFVNQHKLKVGLNLIASEVTWEAIDTISSLEYYAYAKTVEEFPKLVLEYPSIPIIFNGVSIHNPVNVKASRICHSVVTEYDLIEILTVYSYADNIIEHYISALKMILQINNKIQYLNEYVAPVVADWPRQIFIRKALYMHTVLNLQAAIPSEIKLLLSMLGPLHFSLNKLTHNRWIKIKSNIIRKFGQICKDIEYRTMLDLFDNLVPATLDVYAILLCS